jgi:hypothetical protein
MPDHKIHYIACKQILGKAYPVVDKYMDQAQPLLQSKHRLLFHDVATIEMFSEIDENAGMAAYIHILLDAVSDLVGQEEAVPVLIELINDGVI